MRSIFLTVFLSLGLAMPAAFSQDLGFSDKDKKDKEKDDDGGSEECADLPGLPLDMSKIPLPADKKEDLNKKNLLALQDDTLDHFAEFLLYYQDRIEKLGEGLAADEMRKLVFRPQYDQIKFAGMSQAADKNLIRPELKKYWSYFKKRPWKLLKMLTGGPSGKGFRQFGNEENPFKKDFPNVFERDLNSKSLHIAYFDDGQMIFKWMLDLIDPNHAYGINHGVKPPQLNLEDKPKSGNDP